MLTTRRWVVLALWICFVATVPLTAQNAAPMNLLENGDFEKDAAGEPSRGKVPTGWAKSYGSPAALVIVEEVRPGSEGDTCLKIDTKDKVLTSGCLSKWVPVDPKKPFKIMGWLRDGGSMAVKQRPFIGIAWYDAQRKPIVTVPNTKVNYIYVNFRKKPDWQLFTHTLVPVPEGGAHVRYKNVPPNAAFAEIRLFVIKYAGPVWFDDVLVTQEVDAGK